MVAIQGASATVVQYLFFGDNLLDLSLKIFWRNTICRTKKRDKAAEVLAACRTLSKGFVRCAALQYCNG